MFVGILAFGGGGGEEAAGTAGPHGAGQPQLVRQPVQGDLLLQQVHGLGVEEVDLLPRPQGPLPPAPLIPNLIADP